MHIRRARPKDLPGIQALMGAYDKFQVESCHINHRDIALVAEHEHTIVGFVWVGLMAKNTMGRVDKFAVRPEYSRRGVGEALGRELLCEAKKRGVKYLSASIRHDQYHNASCANALKIGMQGDTAAYTAVFANVDHSISELKALRYT